MENNENISQEPVLESPFAEPPYEPNLAPETEVPAEASAESPATDATEDLEEALYFEDGEPIVWPKKKKHSFKFLKVCIAAILVVALIATGCGVTAHLVTQYHIQQNNQLVRAISHLNQKLVDLQKEVESNSFTGNGNSISGTPVPSDGLTPGQIHAQNRNSVVAITNQGVTTNIFGQTTQTASAGSGFVISEDGYIVTNYHVIKGAQKLTVITNNEQKYPATVVGYDDQNDFALIKVEVSGWTPVKLGSSNDLIVGDQVVAIGNPLGQITNTLTVGYISAKDRNVSIEGTVINMLQTDAALNPGNSGGALFNMKGEVIGITTAGHADEAVEGINFAIPIDDVADMITELLEFGYISSPHMGVTVNKQADGMGIYVSSVEAGFAAAKAGMMAGDIILAIGNYETNQMGDLGRVLRNFEPGDTAVIQVYRNRQILELTITFGSKYQPRS